MMFMEVSFEGKRLRSRHLTFIYQAQSSFQPPLPGIRSSLYKLPPDRSNNQI